MKCTQANEMHGNQVNTVQYTAMICVVCECLLLGHQCIMRPRAFHTSLTSLALYHPRNMPAFLSLSLSTLCLFGCFVLSLLHEGNAYNLSDRVHYSLLTHRKRARHTQSTKQVAPFASRPPLFPFLLLLGVVTLLL